MKRRERVFFDAGNHTPRRRLPADLELFNPQVKILPVIIVFDEFAEFDVIQYIQLDRGVAADLLIHFGPDQIESADADVCEVPAGRNQPEKHAAGQQETEKGNEGHLQQPAACQLRQQTEMIQFLMQEDARRF